MFAVIFEVQPRPDRWDAYLGHAKLLRPELEKIDGFIDNIRYRSLTRQGWILSLSSWRDEKSVVRWRTAAGHHVVQERGRAAILLDYRLRVGEITSDTHVPAGHEIREQRLDETEAGDARAMILIDAKRAPGASVTPEKTAHVLGLERRAPGLVAWDVYDAVLTPGDLMLTLAWRTKEDAEAFTKSSTLPRPARRRQVRIIRDYGLSDRREAPQYYPPASAPAADESHPQSPPPRE